MSQSSHEPWSAPHPPLDTVEGSRHSSPHLSQSAMQILEYSAQNTPLGLVVFDQSGVCGWTNYAAGPVLGLKDPQVLVGHLNWWEHCSIPGSDSKALWEQAFHGSVTELTDLLQPAKLHQPSL
jgi:hypothetical protein